MASKKDKKEHKKWLIERYTSIKEDYIESGFPHGWNVLLSDTVIRMLKAGIDPQKVEDWAANIDNMWKKTPS